MIEEILFLIMKNLFKRSFVLRGGNNQKGAAALIVVIILTALIILIVSFGRVVGMDSLEFGFSAKTGQDVLIAAESCTEEALLRLSRDASYRGGNLSIGDTICTITISGTNPCTECEVNAEATGNGFTRTIQAQVLIEGEDVVIKHWEEID